MKTISVRPELSSTDAATAFIEETLRAEGCPEPALMKLCIVTDELFSNIARYSGATEAKLSCGVENGAAELRFCDNGAPYDPTAAPEPDFSLPAEAREAGGLGILMARRFLTGLAYVRRNGWNELTARKEL